jgi:alginate O-acetyltransferase complex protein AlgI
LSSWFRDYVYIPLGGSKAGELKWARNVLVTFLLSGLWHGASWHYVLWGGYHGVLLILTRAHRILMPATSPETAGSSGSALRRLVVPLQIAGIFILTLFGWLLFRETELAAIARDLRLSL